MYIKEFSKKTNLSIDTLRFYEKEGLIIPDRDENNYRVYRSEHCEWINFVKKLKATRLSLDGIKEYICLMKKGDRTREKRKEILLNELSILKQQEQELKNTIDYVQKKIKMYEVNKI